MRHFITLLFLYSSYISINAQNTISIDSIQVTATQIPTLVKETGKSITVMSSEQIDQLPISSVEELLRYVAGVNLNVRNQFGVQTDIGMRGSTFSQVLVLLDNVRVNGPLTGHFNNNVPIGMAEIARVEIIRGPASASYGADAVGGVIHIKSKTYVEAGTDGVITDISGSVSAGSHQLQRMDIGMFLKNDRWSISASAKTNISDGESRTNPNFTAGTSPDSLWNNDFDVRTYSAAVAYRISEEINWYTRVGYDHRDFSAKYFYTRSAFDESRETVRTKWLQSSLRHQSGKSTNELSFGLAQTQDYFVFNPLFTPNLHDTRQLLLNYTHQRNLSSTTQIAFGAQGINRKIESNDRGDHDNLNYGVFATLSHFVTSDFKSTLSARVEQDENFGTELLPQLNMAYFLGDMTIRSSVGKSIRAGDFTERYVSNLLPNLGAGRNAGNPDLRAERAWTFDMGVDYQMGKNSWLNTTVFYRTSTNLIDFILTNSNDISNLTNLQENTDYYYATNVSSAKTTGLELGLRNIAQFNDHTTLNTTLNATWLNTSTGAGEPSKYIANHPNLNVNASLNLDYKNWSINSSSFLIYRDAEAVESILGEVKSNYFVSNLRIGYTPLSRGVSLFAEVNNVGNTSYQEILGAPLPERWFMAGFRFDLK